MTYELFERCLAAAAKACGMTVEELLAKTKDREVVLARRMALYLAYHGGPMSMTTISRHITKAGLRMFRPTVAVGIAEFEAQIDEEQETYGEMGGYLIEKLKQARKYARLKSKSELNPDEHI